MLGFKRFETAAITIGGIEFAEKTRNLLGRPVADPDVWAAVLATCLIKKFSNRSRFTHSSEVCT